MDFHLVNLSAEYIPKEREVHTLMVAALFSETNAFYVSDIADARIMLELDFYERHPKMLLEAYRSFYALHLGEQAVEQTIQAVEAGLKIQFKKIRTKADLIFQAETKKALKLIKASVDSYLKWSILTYNLQLCNALFKAGRIRIGMHIRNRHAGEATHEQEVQFNIDQLGIGEDEWMCTEHMADLMNVIKDHPGNTTAALAPMSMLEFKLFDLPGCTMLKPGKLKLIHEEMQNELTDWRREIKAMEKALEQVSFTAANLALINGQCEGVRMASERLRIKTDDSIYLSQLRNNDNGEYGGTVSLCVTSRAAVLEAMYKESFFSESVFTETMKHFINNDTADKVVCFFTHRMTTYPEIRKEIPREEIDSLWEKSFE